MASKKNKQFKVNTLAALVATVACHGVAWAEDAPTQPGKGSTIQLQNSVIAASHWRLNPTLATRPRTAQRALKPALHYLKRRVLYRW